MYVFHMPLPYCVKPHVMALFGRGLHRVGVIATLGVLPGAPHLPKVLAESPILTLKDCSPRKLPALA